MASLFFVLGWALSAAGSKLWPPHKRGASDVSLVNRLPSAQPIAASHQLEGNLGGACIWIS
ncbi:hypothetical protein D3C73_918160 [compost metagenome]